MYIHKPTKRYPYSFEQLKRDNPQISFPKVINAEILSNFEVHFVNSVEYPEFDSKQKSVREIQPIEVDGQWFQQWEVYDLSPEEVASNKEAAAKAIQDAIVSATQKRLDDFARTRNYDGILSLCTYATDINPKFAAEGQYGVEARSATWDRLYEILAEVEQSVRPTPSGYADIEADLPPLAWPK